MARAKKTSRPIPTKEEALKHAQVYASTQSSLKKLEAKIELEINQLKEANKEEIASLQAQAKENFTEMQRFAEHNKDDLFGKKKSMDLVHAKIGFRTSNPSVKKGRNPSWEEVAGYAEKYEETQGMVRVKKEINKDFILLNRDNEDFMAKVKEWGIRVEQKETFFVETKEEDLQKS